MNVTRSRVALVADMDKLWAIGGYDGMKNLSTVRGLLFMTFFVYRYIFFYFLRNPDSIGMASLCRIWFPILHFLGSVNYLFFFVTYWYSSFVNTVGMS